MASKKHASVKRDVVTVESFFDRYGTQLELKLVAGEKGLQRIIREPTVNRPGLALAGFTRYFASKRVQVIGSAEAHFLKTLNDPDRQERYSRVLSYKIPCIVFGRNLNPDSQFLEAVERVQVPLFKTPLITMKFINLATLALEMMFAPHRTEIGSMVDIHGVGVLIKGETGIGKSESVLALIERGYSLVADDITHVTLVDEREIVGTSSELTRNHMEVRGIGIINVAAMFGVRSTRSEKRVDIVINLKTWNETDDIDRLGMEEEHTDILGIQIPKITIPVRPGRDLARLIEVAAFQMKLKTSGYNAAKELNERLIAKMGATKNP